MDLYDLYGAEQPDKEPTPEPVVEEKYEAELPPSWFTALDEESVKEKILVGIRNGKIDDLVANKVASESKLKEIETYFAERSFIKLEDRIKSVKFTKKAKEKKKSINLTFFRGGVVFKSEGQALKKGISLWWKLIAINKTEEGITTSVDLPEFEEEMIKAHPGEEMPKESWKLVFSSDEIELVFDKYPTPKTLGAAWMVAKLRMMDRHPKMKNLSKADVMKDSPRLEFGAKWDGTSKTDIPDERKKKLRFYTGQFVKCNCGNPIIPAWQMGRVIGFWYKEPYFPAEHPGFPYQVCLENGQLIFAPADDNMVVRAVKKEEFKALSERTRSSDAQSISKNIQATVQKLMPKLAQGMEPTEAEWKAAEEKCPDLDRDQARKMVKMMLMQRMAQMQGGGHGHSHGGRPCNHSHGGNHGHSHGAPGGHRAGPPSGGHGHSHGGKPCSGHGH